jgi:SAM-dependent methyltransferase
MVLNMKPAARINTFTFAPSVCCLCGESDYGERYRIERFKQGTLVFVACRNCGTVYQNPMPTQESMQEFYHSANFFKSTDTAEEFTGYQDYDGEEVIRMKNAERRLDEVEAVFPVGKRIRLLKIGCGYGALVKLARDRGHPAEGIDFSAVMTSGARQRYGIDLIHDNFLEHDFGETRYDAILLYGAINNFLRPLEVAARVHDLLAPGGFYFVNHVWLNSFPERIFRHRYWIYRPPIVGLYPRAEFDRRHEPLGFEVFRSAYDVQYVTLDKLVGYLKFQSLLRLLRRCRLAEIGLTLPLPGYAKIIFRKPAAA